MAGPSSDAGVYTSSHQSALELELSILAALLERNRCSHGRTKYFQRLSMAHRCLKRHAIIDLYNRVQTLESELSQLNQRERKRRQREKIFWEIKASDDGETSRSLHDLRSDLRARLRRVAALATEHMGEAVSRLDHAAEALFAEVARGFFLPLNAVAVAAVARVRALLLRLATHTLQAMPALQAAYRGVFQDDLDWTSEQLNTAMNRYHDMSSLKPEERSSEQELVETTLKRMGITLATTNASDSPRETNGICSASNRAGADNGATRNLSTSVDLVKEDDDDMGVAFVYEETDRAAATATAITALKVEQAIDPGIDMNYALVKQVTQDNRDRKRKSKEKTVDDRARKKKKKVKKPDKKDFFDKLFGTRA